MSRRSPTKSQNSSGVLIEVLQRLGDDSEDAVRATLAAGFHEVQ